MTYIGARAGQLASHTAAGSGTVRPLTLVSNRLPVTLRRGPRAWHCAPSQGGLVRALEPVLRRHGGTWIGWSGVAHEDVPDEAERIARAGASHSYHLASVPLHRGDVSDFYEGFCNRVLWPLFHDLSEQCEFASGYFARYMDVNRRFANRVAQLVDEDGIVWVQDYHLMHVGALLRERTAKPSCLAFFLHIPFPPFDVFSKLPWANDVLRALLAYDLVGFQTDRDTGNFLDCVARSLPSARVRGVRPRARTPASSFVDFRGHSAQVQSFPIGIDFPTHARQAAASTVETRVGELERSLGGVDIVLGVDRLDYTKGLLQRLDGFERALERYPEMLEAVSLLQLVVPSREGIREYQSLKRRLDRRVGEINGRFGTPGYVPVHYHYRSVPMHELLALYRAARVALVTPLKDGMNLVCKEFCAARVDEDGVLVLSEFAGAVAQLGNHAIQINPYDADAMACAIHVALSLPRAERRARMRALRTIVERQDISVWVEDVLSAAHGFGEGAAAALRSSA